MTLVPVLATMFAAQQLAPDHTTHLALGTGMASRGCAEETGAARAPLAAGAVGVHDAAPAEHAAMSGPPPLRLRFLDFQLDEADKRLLHAGRPVELRPKAFAVLCTLARTPGQLVEKDDLLDAVWGHRHVSESVLKTTISQLRTALGDDPREPRCIETASRYGYRFIAEPLGDVRQPAPFVAAPAAAPRGAALPPAAAVPLVARDGALAVLSARFAAATAGQRQLVFVAGEAGIGKSTLIDRFVGTLPAQAAVGVGQCVEQFGSAEPYMPVLEALNAWCAADAALVALMRRVAPTWLVQLPWHLDGDDRRELQREVAGATQDRMLREFGELLDRHAAVRPLVLVIEDLHWSDQATVQLIGYLARRRTGAALLVLASFRPADVVAGGHPLGDLRHELRLHRLCHEIDLEAFSEAELGRWIAERTQGADVPEDFVRALHRHTEGLPLFAVNLLDELLDAGTLRRDAGGWRFPAATELGVPGHVAGVVDKQIGRLPDAVQRLLGAASVAGTDFGHVALAQVLGEDPAAVQQQLDDVATQGHWLKGSGLVQLPGGAVSAAYAFRHALYPQVLYRRLALAQRMQWHRRWAAALAGLHGSAAGEIAAELALHSERGGDSESAMRHYAALAARALSRSAAREALHAVRQGLGLLAGRPRSPRHELELRLQEALALTRLHVVSEPVVGDAFERAAALAEQAIGSPACVPALHGLWWLRFTRCELHAARDAAARLLALPADDRRGELAGYTAMGMTLAMLGDLPEARLHLAAAIECGPGAADDDTAGFGHDPIVAAHAYLAVVEWWRGDAAAARAQAAAALARAESLRHPMGQLLALNMAAAMHLFAGEPRQALERVDRLYAIIEQHDLPRGLGSFSWLHGRAVARLSDVAAGLAEIRGAEQHCRRIGLLIGLSACYLHLAEACRDAGLDEQSMAAADAGLAFAAERCEGMLRSPLHLLAAALHERRGESDAAARHRAEALRIAREQGAAFFEARALAAPAAPR